MDPTEFEPLTIEDLKRIFIRAQDGHGKWGTVSCFEATDLQFQEWIITRISVVDDDSSPWSLEERRDVCNILWQNGALAMLKRDLPLEEEGYE